MSGRKKQRKSRMSNGVHGTNRSHGKAQGMRRLLNQLDAYKKGKNVVLTLPTKDGAAATQRINAKDWWSKKV